MLRRYVYNSGTLVGCFALVAILLVAAQAVVSAADRDLQPRTQACCFRSTGACEDIASKECRERGGKPGGRGTECDAEGFECFQKPCCLPDDTCDMMSEDSCDAAQGTVKRGRNCTNVDCAAPPRGAQACCIDNECSDLTRSDCTSQDGDPQGRGTACDDPDFECQASGFTQACCIDGVCSNLSRADCTSQGGDPQGFGTSCTPDFDCGSTTGRTVACCTDGLCDDLTSADCTAAGGTSQGFGTACDDKTVDCAGGGPEGEVCCLPDDVCDTLRPFACRRAGGTMTPGDGCDPNPCGP